METYWDAFLEYIGREIRWRSPAELLEGYHEWLAVQIANGEKVFRDQAAAKEGQSS